MSSKSMSFKAKINNYAKDISFEETIEAVRKLLI